MLTRCLLAVSLVVTSYACTADRSTGVPDAGVSVVAPTQAPSRVDQLTAIATDEGIDAEARLNAHTQLAAVELSGGDHHGAYERLITAATTLRSDSALPAAGFLMARIANERLKEPETAELTVAALRDYYPASPIIERIPEGYREIPSDDIIAAMQSKVFTGDGFDREAAIRYSQATLPYAVLLPQDSLAADVHIKSAQALIPARYFPLAKRHLDAAEARVPGTTQAGSALFLNGFITFEEEGDEVQGRALLRRFVDAYPQHPLASDAERLLDED